MAGRFVAGRPFSMRFLGRLLGYVSIVVNLMLSLALLFFGLIASFAASDMQIDLVPAWTGSVTGTVLLGGLAGVIAVVLAIRPGKVSRLALVLWSLLVALILSSAFWSSSYRFDGYGDFQRSLGVFAVYLLVLIGSWARFRAAKSKR